jgi:hypothetical protein
VYPSIQKHMKSTKSPSKTTFTYTLDSTMTERSGEQEVSQDSPSTTNKKLTPPYYHGKYKGIEAFDVCMDFARDSYNIGVAIAYLLRAGKKPNNPKAQDLRKAIHHLEIELQYEETFNPTPQTTEDRKS